MKEKVDKNGLHIGGVCDLIDGRKEFLHLDRFFFHWDRFFARKETVLMEKETVPIRKKKGT